MGPFQRRSERPVDKKFTNIYVKNLSEAVTDEMLREIFSPHGAITSAVVMKDASGKSKGFGFVNFETAEAAAAAVDALEGKEVEGKAINGAGCANCGCSLYQRFVRAQGFFYGICFGTALCLEQRL